MDTIFGQYFLDNNEYNSCRSIGFKFNSAGFTLYEVIRVINGSLLFLDDHLERLNSGLKRLRTDNEPDWENLRVQLYQLIRANNLPEGNLKLLCQVNAQDFRFAAFYIPHFYPNESMYRKGVKLICYPAQRPDPQLKQLGISEKIKGEIEEIRQKANAYEVLLVNEDGYITEGSKSNFFLIKDSVLFTAPESEILNGITRKYVLTFADREGLKVNEIHFSQSDLYKYDAGFICGTSPKILGVSSIDNQVFNRNNSIIDLLSNRYDSVILEYIINNHAKYKSES